MKQLLMLGVNINAKDDEGVSALMDVEACRANKAARMSTMLNPIS